VRHDGAPLVALLAPHNDEGIPGVRLQAAAPRRALAEAWLACLRELMRERNVYRGKVLSFGGEHPFRRR